MKPEEIEIEPIPRSVIARLLGMSQKTTNAKFAANSTWGSVVRQLWQMVQIEAATQSDADTDIEEAERRLKIAKAGLAELDLQQARGELVRASDRDAAEAKRIGLARSGLLTLPVIMRIKAGLTTQQIEIVENEIRTCMERISESMEDEEV
jgi:hypothetical protein